MLKDIAYSNYNSGNAEFCCNLLVTQLNLCLLRYGAIREEGQTWPNVFVTWANKLESR